ncbi:EthD domain-containing protein [Erwinia sp. MMLR14_017]|uniref:EthD domain-containing protein n=1 Tax=Erwinia sp. MMLR14_017 TaxID=3093842 RepID=UPI00299015B0|nr:EthD domain-containing protein [Erwinia sp. MMLR14_017]MDW8847777.1 EthD domain-containing protein [Erwinia sp. MMLR14_017]
MNDKIRFSDPARSDMLQRPPLLQSSFSTTKPLIVTPTLLRRSDNTPESVRPHDSGSGVDSQGNEVTDPEHHSDRLALEAEPNLAFEHYDEYWRKVHGPKFALAGPDTQNETVLRYDQVHRLPSGPSSSFSPPYRAMVDDEGRLLADPAAHVPPYRRPSWDGFAYIAYQSEEDVEETLAQEQYAKRIVADEQTVFRKVTRQLAREYIIIPSIRHRDPFSLVKIHYRQDSLSREDFQRQWLHEHADLVVSKAATKEYVRRYAQLHSFSMTQEDPEGEKIDGISVFSFDSLNDLEDYLCTEEWAEIEKSEHSIADAQASEFWTSVNYSVINRLMPEQATEK